jgi:putative transposase
MEKYFLLLCTRVKSEEILLLMRLLDEQYTWTPFYGTRRMTAWLHTLDYPLSANR